MGASISCALITIAYRAFKDKANDRPSNFIGNELSKIGMSTLEIYILHSFILEVVLARFVKLPADMPLLESSLIFVPASVAIIYVCMGCKYLIDKNKISKLLVFGKFS